MSREKPISGYKKLQLMRLLAEGEHTQAELAERFETAVGTITQFKHRHKAEIQEIQQNLADEFAGLWIAKKENRISEYQAQAERFRESEDPKLVARTQTALRSVAEELGALPTRQTVNLEGSAKVHHVVNGVDLGDVT